MFFQIFPFTTVAETKQSKVNANFKQNDMEIPPNHLKSIIKCRIQFLVSKM